MLTSETIAIIALVVSIVEFLYQRFVAGVQRDIRYETRFKELETKVELYWNSVEIKLANQVHSPHTPEIDALLGKITDGSVTISERVQLRSLLLNQLCDTSSDKNKCTATEILIAIQDVKIQTT